MKCEFIKPDGTKCEAHAIKDSEFCYFHDPNISDEEKREAQSNGGKTKALTLKKPLPNLPIAEPEDAVLLVADTIKRVRAGELDIRTANCLFIGTNALIKAFELARLNDKAEFIERVLSKGKTKH